MNQLQHDMRRILLVMEQTGGKLDQILKGGLDTGLISPRSVATDSGSQSPLSRTTFPSPFILPPSFTSPSLPSDRNGSANEFLREPTAEHPRQHLEPLQLPSPLIDHSGFHFDEKLPDLTLHPNFLKEASSVDFPYARTASRTVQDTFINEITEGRNHVVMSVLRSNYGQMCLLNLG
jgi:hypothetical protein